MHTPLTVELAELIISAELEPGTHLTAASLASRLNVSRTPIREALREISTLGLVELRGNRGAFVVDPTSVPDRNLIDLVKTRSRLEPWLMSIAAQNRDERDIETINQVLDIGTLAVETHDHQKLSLAHHKALLVTADAAHNLAASQALAPLIYQTSLLFATSPFSKKVTGWGIHKAIGQAIVDANANRAEQLLASHLSEVLELLSD